MAASTFGGAIFALVTFFMAAFASFVANFHEAVQFGVGKVLVMAGFAWLFFASNIGTLFAVSSHGMMAYGAFHHVLMHFVREVSRFFLVG